jgi:membrane associated rhomboid family serine protease
MTFSELIKHQFRNGGWGMRLIFLNVAVFLFIKLLYTIDNGMTNFQGPMSQLANNLFVLPFDLKSILWRPWTLITHMFTHYDFFHLFFNMVWLYFGSQFFRQFLGDKRLIYVYIFGGLAAAFAQILADYFIPFYQFVPGTSMVGASGAVSAVFIAVAWYRPMFQVMLFGLVPIKLVFIALFMVIMDFLRVMDVTNVAHMAHLGGAAFGAVAIANLTRFDRLIVWFERKTSFFKGGFSAMRSKLFMRVKKAPEAKHYHKADEAFFESKIEIQANIDRILEKIKQKGYGGLTKAEKDYLFKQKDKI